jgi:putative ABC transport system substrate-binding protein
MRRRAFIRASVGAALAWSLGARAEQPAKIRHIGLLGSTSRSEYAEFVEALQEGLRQLGYVDGKNIAIHYRWAEGRYNLLPDLAADLVRLNVDVILTHGTPGTRAAKEATATIPIVGIVVGDLVSTGLVPSLARPGGNLTGQTFFFAEINAKRLELIKEAVPGVARAAVLTNPANMSRQIALAAMELTAQALQIELVPVEASARDELAGAFDMMAKKGAHALVVFDDPVLNSNAEYVAELAAKSRIPMIAGKYRAKPEAFMTYGVDISDIWFRSAGLVDKILKGTKPADLPIRQATKFELIINLNSAQALGLTVPPSLLARAAEVIE